MTDRDIAAMVVTLSRALRDAGVPTVHRSHDGFVHGFASVLAARGSREAVAEIGGTLRAQDNMLLYAEYDAIVPTGNTTDHRVAAGLRLRF